MAADELKGYKGLARERLTGWRVRVWSDVRLVNDAGSVFEGVILPRSETLDDEHVVIKMKNGYNVGIHVDRVAGVKVRNIKTGVESALEVKGLFIAIGHTPNTDFLKGSGLGLDEKGYVKLGDGFRTCTNIPGVFAAGDLADPIYRQAITAAGMGCKAALDAERWLAEQGVH